MSDPSVHSEETSQLKSPNLTYRELRIRQYPDEYPSSIELYEAIDRLDGKSRKNLLTKCRTFAYFAWHRPSGQIRVSSNACRQRWCPICSGSKAKQITFNLEKFIRQLHSPKFMTLTQKHSNAPLKHQIQTLYDNFTKLRRNKYFKTKIKGGVWFFQIKKSSSTNQWHPHLHCLLDGSYIWQNDLSKIWESITLTSKVVDIRAVRTPEKTAEYIARYSSRPSSLSPLCHEDRIELFYAMHGRRLAGTWGSANGMNLTKPPDPDHSEYVNLGSYETIRKNISKNADAKMIWKAWCTGNPIAEPHYVVPEQVVSFDRLEKPWLYFSYDDFDWS